MPMPLMAPRKKLSPTRAYSFADATQIIANIEASHTSDQAILSESLDIQPPAKILSDKTASGDRRIRASLSGNVNIRYMALVENNVRRLLPKSGRQHLWSDLPSEVLPFLLPSRFCPSDKFMRFAQREFGGCGDGWRESWRCWNGYTEPWIAQIWDLGWARRRPRRYRVAAAHSFSVVLE
jgi:hypothetical protein